ncbi:nucleolus and neural progenitor protein isoform X2 [Amia ocellicauda]|uniref:nucleolus and neural progenitor protein isoform X2 n=1 Tax=Amia ocellicauda TaxID=2972642 RepID=UPI003463DD83
MAAEPWNKLEIAYPGVLSAVRFQFNASTEQCMKCLRKECEKVLKLLKSKVLQTEIRILYALLYVFHHRLRQHKPYQALKKVEQCVNRLRNMRLEAALEDLKGMCPNLPRLREGGQHEVPSQPVLEWLSLKVLGASKLMMHLMECCSEAFLLVLQHLYWKEFIILNVVLTGMLSRLWVYSRGILKTLTCLYEQMFAFLQEVSQIQQMPFVKYFALPADIKTFLGPSYSQVVEIKPPEVPVVKKLQVTARSGLLNKLFASGAGRNSEYTELSHSGMKTKWTALKGLEKNDLGNPVLGQHSEDLRNLPEFDVKALLRQPQGASKVNSTASQDSWKDGRYLPLKKTLILQKESYVWQIEWAASFSDLAASLKQLVNWCKRENLLYESRRLNYQYLKCQRLMHLETQGYSLKRKLHFYKQICKSMFLGTRTLKMPLPSLITKWKRSMQQMKFRVKGKLYRPHSKAKNLKNLISAVDYQSPNDDKIHLFTLGTVDELIHNYYKG